ncbi:MAG TPA: hypothetical protein VEA16_09930, partial [Vicinamibacterales bacterium]|nr:hypothetical protein [Vicinamibacterales bacterium]
MTIARGFDSQVLAEPETVVVAPRDEATLVMEKESVPITAVLDIPYGYARANGVLVVPRDEGELVIALREGSDPSVLLEVRRHLGRPFRVERAAAAAFDGYLQTRYALDQSAAGLAGSIDRNDDLDALASGIPTAE